MDIWVHEYAAAGMYGYMDAVVYRHRQMNAQLDAWICGHMDTSTWAHGCMDEDTGTHRCMDTWMY